MALSDPAEAAESTSIARPEADAPALAIVGVGNPIMGDDGIGARVIEDLEPRLADREDVLLATAGTTAFFALEAMSGCDRAIVIDAIATGAEPGTVQEYRYEDGSFTGTVPEMTMHDFSFAEALQAGREAYDLPDPVVILGVEPDRIELSMDLSDPIEAALPALRERVLGTLPSHHDK